MGSSFFSASLETQPSAALPCASVMSHARQASAACNRAAPVLSSLLLRRVSRPIERSAGRVSSHGRACESHRTQLHAERFHRDNRMHEILAYFLTAIWEYNKFVLHVFGTSLCFSVTISVQTQTHTNNTQQKTTQGRIPSPGARRAGQ